MASTEMVKRARSKEGVKRGINSCLEAILQEAELQLRTQREIHEHAAFGIHYLRLQTNDNLLEGTPFSVRLILTFKILLEI